MSDKKLYRVNVCALPDGEYTEEWFAFLARRICVSSSLSIREELLLRTAMFSALRLYRRGTIRAISLSVIYGILVGMLRGRCPWKTTALNHSAESNDDVDAFHSISFDFRFLDGTSADDELLEIIGDNEANRESLSNLVVAFRVYLLSNEGQHFGFEVVSTMFEEYEGILNSAKVKKSRFLREVENCRKNIIRPCLLRGITVKFDNSFSDVLPRQLWENGVFSALAAVGKDGIGADELREKFRGASAAVNYDFANSVISVLEQMHLVEVEDMRYTLSVNGRVCLALLGKSYAKQRIF